MRLDLDDTIVDFEVKGYKKSSLGNWAEEWCHCSLSITNKYMDYHEESDMLLCNEVESIKDKLGLLLKGELPRREHLFFAEPVLEFRLRPAANTEEGEADIDAFWIVNLRDDSGMVTANSLHLLMDRSAIERFEWYLRDVIKAATVVKKAPYTFKYWVDLKDGRRTMPRRWVEEITPDEQQAIELSRDKSKLLANVKGADKMVKRITDKIKSIEADNILDSDVWTEESYDKYGTGDPFKVFDLIIEL